MTAETTNQPTAPETAAAPATENDSLEQELEALNNRGACMMAFVEFMKAADDDDVDLLDSVLRMYLEPVIRHSDTLEGIMSRAAYHGERHWEREESARDERKAVAAFTDIHRANRGSVTPAESLVVRLVDRFAEGGTLTPEGVDLLVTEFRENYPDAVTAAKRMLERNPKALAPTAA